MPLLRRLSDATVEATKAAMIAGDEYIVQAALKHERWVGRADIVKGSTRGLNLAPELHLKRSNNRPFRGAQHTGTRSKTLCVASGAILGLSSNVIFDVPSLRRTDFKSGKLTQSRIEKLVSLPNWNWDASDKAAHNVLRTKSGEPM